MLRQILNDMYVDPEILSGLDEYQKQTLFCKMREEQIRRWRVREQENDNNRSMSSKKSTPNRKNKNVSFREDNEGEPLVIVIEPAIYTDSDSDDSDLSMRKPGHEEAKQRARELAEIETKELRRQYKEIITDFDNGSNCKKDKVIAEDDSIVIIDDMEIYCSVEELRERMNQTKIISTTSGIASAPKLKNGNLQKNINFSFTDNQNEKNAILKEISNNKPNQKVSAKIALWEKRVIGEKTNEIYQRLRKKQKEQAQEEAKKQEEAWKEQERKAKEADIQYREIARRAREEHRKSLNSEETTSIVSATNGLINKCTVNGTNGTPNGKMNGEIRKPNGLNGMNGFVNGSHSPMINGSSAKGPAPQPPSLQSMPQTQPPPLPSSSPPSSLDSLIPRPATTTTMIKWYRDVEIAKGSGLETAETRLPCKWFYGLMSRTDAEHLLETEPMGTFLVRLSEKIWGYAISYKDGDRCKHYLINASTGQYKFLGANQLNHPSLNNLIKHHATVPITAMGNELLIRPCPRNVTVNTKIFEGLF